MEDHVVPPSAQARHIRTDPNDLVRTSEDFFSLSLRRFGANLRQ
jgi:hypothetical protein